MKPIKKSVKPTSALKKPFYFIVKHKKIKVVWLVVIFFNTIVLALHMHR